MSTAKTKYLLEDCYDRFKHEFEENHPLTLECLFQFARFYSKPSDSNDEEALVDYQHRARMAMELCESCLLKRRQMALDLSTIDEQQLNGEAENADEEERASNGTQQALPQYRIGYIRTLGLLCELTLRHRGTTGDEEGNHHLPQPQPHLEEQLQLRNLIEILEEWLQEYQSVLAQNQNRWKRHLPWIVLPIYCLVIEYSQWAKELEYDIGQLRRPRTISSGAVFFTPELFWTTMDTVYHILLECKTQLKELISRDDCEDEEEEICTHWAVFNSVQYEVVSMLEQIIDKDRHDNDGSDDGTDSLSQQKKLLQCFEEL